MVSSQDINQIESSQKIILNKPVPYTNKESLIADNNVDSGVSSGNRQIVNRS